MPRRWGRAVKAPFLPYCQPVNLCSRIVSDGRLGREIVFTRRTQTGNAGETGSAYVRRIMAADKTLVVVGQGMVGYKLLECLVENGAAGPWRVIAFGEEPRGAYDRVSLSTYFAGR